MTKQYEVQERFTDGTGWYRHGYSGENREKALETLTRLRFTYGKYSRIFRLVSRDIADWKVEA